MNYSLSFRPEIENDAKTATPDMKRKPQVWEKNFFVCFTPVQGKYDKIRFCTERYTRISDVVCWGVPHAVYFGIHGQQVVVFGLFHCARKPAVVNKELRDRHNINP